MTTGLIYKKMANVYSKVDAIAKTKSNTGSLQYPFRGIDDVYNTLHKVFAEEGIFVTPEILNSERSQIVNKSGSIGYHTVSKIKYTFYAEDNSFVSAITEGEAIDYGDKSTSKSQSMSFKYALLQTFMIPTEDTEDGDKTSPEAGKKKDVTPAALKTNAKGEIELPQGNHADVMAKLNKCKTEAHLLAYQKIREAHTWTPAELKEQDDFIKALREQWKTEADAAANMEQGDIR